MKMIGILLYSVNDNNVDKLRNAFKSESDFELSSNELGDPLPDKGILEKKDLVRTIKAQGDAAKNS